MGIDVWGRIYASPVFFGLVIVSGVVGALGSWIAFMIVSALMDWVLRHEKPAADAADAADNAPPVAQGNSPGQKKPAPPAAKDSIPRFLFTGLLMGIVERFFFTFSILALGGNGAMQAAVAWIAIKGQVHFKIFTDNSNHRDVPRAYLGMFGSLVSMAFAILGGFICLKHYSIPGLLAYLHVALCLP